MSAIWQTLNFEELYFIAISLLSLFVLFWGIFKINRAKRKRLQFAKEMFIGEAVETDAIDDDSFTVIRRQNIQNIEGRFNIIQRTFVPVVLGVAALLFSLPFLTIIPATYLSLIAGVLAILIGIATKPLIENVVSGIVITLSQPIRLNDTIDIDGQYGTVEHINLLYTVIKIWNWRRYVIPNYKLLQKEFQNLSRNDEPEWAHVRFYVAPNCDIEQVKHIAKQAMQGPHLLTSEQPSFWVMQLEKDAIECWVAGWSASPAESWALKSQTRKNLVMAFRKAGIDSQLIQNQVQLSRPSGSTGG